MATDSWALAVDRAGSGGRISTLHIKDTPEENGTSSAAAANTTPQSSNSSSSTTTTAKTEADATTTTTPTAKTTDEDDNDDKAAHSFEELRLWLQGVYGLGFKPALQNPGDPPLPMMLAEPSTESHRPVNSPGTGKTAAFVLAMLSHVDPNNKISPVPVCVAHPMSWPLPDRQGG
ncbi:hypothetical protein CRUP_037730 [Coryphaenoides rupestris]|nr:hypothetical protein CRUP_037730 [Coryphaenoides rupestris]